jgi:hypothetical protein
MLAFAFQFAFVTLCAASITPSYPRSDYAVKEKHHVPLGWKKVADAPKDAYIALRIALRQSAFDELEKELLEGETGAIPYLRARADRSGLQCRILRVEDMVNICRHLKSMTSFGLRKIPQIWCMNGSLGMGILDHWTTHLRKIG